MTSDILRLFSHEWHAQTQDYTSSSILIDHNLNAAAHFRPETSDVASDLRNAVTRLTHAWHYSNPMAAYTPFYDKPQLRCEPILYSYS